MIEIYLKDTMRVPLHIWAKLSMIEDSAVEQMKNVCNLPVVGPHVALMPDGHLGMGACIGGVVPIKNAVIPNLVGVDISCGIIATKTTFQGEMLQQVLEAIVASVPRSVPLGVGGCHKEPCPLTDMPDLEHGPITASKHDNARLQMGTLGAGNHFIEIQTDEENNTWIMIHSGSRNLGHAICSHYAKAAAEFHKKWHIDSPEHLEWLIPDSDLGAGYICEMEYAIEYARLNRLTMMRKVEREVQYCIEKYDGADVWFEEPIHISHNYAALEHHLGQNYWIHRKGAIRMQEGELGIIPGSCGTSSYIVKGKGNPISFMSASHGAGRIMSRKQYNLGTDLETVEKEMAGIVHTKFRPDKRRRKKGDESALDLSEAPSAYKDIDAIIEQQKELIDVEVKLRPLASIKG